MAVDNTIQKGAAKIISKLILLCLLAILPCLSYAQVLLQRTVVNGSYTQQTVKDVLEDIQKQTGVKFSYSPHQIPESKLVTFSVNNNTLDETLQKLFADSLIDFNEVDGFIILKKAKPQGKQKRNDVPVVDEKPTPEKLVLKPQKPQTFTVSGYIRDQENGETLPAATVYLESLGIGTTTNAYGYFSFELPKGQYVFSFSYVGYRPVLDSILLDQDLTINYGLNTQLLNLGEVQINPYNQDLLLSQLAGAQVTINPIIIRKMPSFMGEPDVIKALEYVPGINFYGEGSGYFNVRGGYFDQNLIVLDEATLFKPTHMLGLFSPIIPDAVTKVDVYKAEFPIGYGGRLSNVVDIRTKDGNKEHLSASGSVGLLALHGTVEGPIKKGSSSYFVSYRRSYFDAYLKSRVPNLNALYFNDFNAKLNFRMGQKDHLYVTLYNGEDQFRFNKNNDDTGGADYQNSSSTIRWNHTFGTKAFLNTTLASSKYNYNAHASLSQEEYWNSKIENAFAKSELTLYHSQDLTLKYGLKLSTYQFEPGIYHAPTYTSAIAPIQSGEIVLYGDADHQLTSRLKINYGLRLTSWRNSGRTEVYEFDEQYNSTLVNYGEKETSFSHTSLEPRLALSYKLKELNYLKASYDRTSQYLNLINNSLSPFNYFEVWLPASKNIKPQSANIYNLSYIRVSKKETYKMQGDVFFKQMNNLIGYIDHAFLMNNPLVEGELRQGEGSSYGLELNVTKQKGRITGQLGYTLARSFVLFDDLNNGVSYRSNYDRPHTLFLNLLMKANDRWEISTNVILASGLPITTPSGFYYYQGQQIPQYNTRNNQRLPLYQRMDVAATYRLNKLHQRFTHYVNFSIMNVLAHQNPMYVYFNKYENAQGELVIPVDATNNQQLTAATKYVYGFLPSVSYHFKF